MITARKAALLMLFCAPAALSWGAERRMLPLSERPIGMQLPELVDNPTAAAIEQYAYLTSFRFYGNGGLVSQAIFGIYPKLNMGFALDVERLINSTTNGVRINRPSLNIKWRFFEGREVLPALAVGFNSLGHYYDRAVGEYAQREKGLYLVGTKEVFFSGLELHGGINSFKFSTGNEIHGFVSGSYAVADVMSVFAEVDNLRTFNETRYNLGFRFFVNPSFSVDADLRNGRGTDPPNTNRRTDRNVQLNYLGYF